MNLISVSALSGVQLWNCRRSTTVLLKRALGFSFRLDLWHESNSWWLVHSTSKFGACFNQRALGFRQNLGEATGTLPWPRELWLNLGPWVRGPIHPRGQDTSINYLSTPQLIISPTVWGSQSYVRQRESWTPLLAWQHSKVHKDKTWIML